MSSTHRRKAPEELCSSAKPSDGPVLVIGPTPPPYNGMTRATELGLGALRESYSVLYLDTADRRGLENVGKFELGNLYLAALHGIKFQWLLLTRWPQIVYVQIAQAWLPFLRDCLFLVPARLLGRKVIVHLNGGYFGRFYRESSPLMRSIIRFALGSASCAIVLGKKVADAFDGIVPRERVRFVPNGIPDNFPGLTPDGRKERDTHPPVLLYLSTLTAEKGFLDLLRALPRVIERVGPIKAIFAGDWYLQEDRDTANDLIERLSLRDLVDFVGPVGPDRKRKLLEKTDLFVFPTAYRFEGHPYVILEAMAAGLPVISTTVACIPETIRDGVEGFLVEPGDIDALAERIGRLLRDPSLRTKMGRAARERFLREYTYEKFAERMKAVFAEVLRPEGEPAGSLPLDEELSEPAARQR